MTSESHRLPVNPGSRVLIQSSLGLIAGVAAMALVAFLFSGADAVSTVVAAGVMTAVVLSLGSWAVHVVSVAMPSASLLVALMTYGLQIVLLTAFMALVSDAPEWGESILPGWFGASVILIVLVWVVLQVVFSVRARVPTYVLPSRDKEAGR